jgi:hypothetical protein
MQAITMNGVSENHQKKSRKVEENLRVFLLKHLIFKKEQEKYIELLMEEDDWDDLIEVNIGSSDELRSKMQESQTNQVTCTKRQNDFMESESAVKRMKL